MTAAALAVAVVASYRATGGTSLRAGPPTHNQGAAVTAASAVYRPTAACNPTGAPLSSPPRQGYQVVLGVIAVPAFVAQRASPTEQPGPWRFFDKQGLFVKAGSPTIDVTVPAAWRRRVAIGWGDASSPVGAQRVTSCSPPPSAWNGYPGGYYLRTSMPLCAPLVVHVKTRTATIRVGIGRRCG